MSDFRLQRSQSLIDMSQSQVLKSSLKTDSGQKSDRSSSITQVHDKDIALTAQPDSKPVQTQRQEVSFQISGLSSSQPRGRAQRMSLTEVVSKDKLHQEEQGPEDVRKGFRRYFSWSSMPQDKSIKSSIKGFFTGMGYTKKISKYEALIEKLIATGGNGIETRKQAKQKIAQDYQGDPKGLKSLKQTTEGFSKSLTASHLLRMKYNPMASRQDKEMGRLFEAFCAKEFSSENPRFLAESHELAKLDLPASRKKMKFLFKHYIQSGSDESINVSSKTRKQAQATYDKLVVAEAYHAAVKSEDPQQISEWREKFIDFKLKSQFPQDVQKIEKLQIRLENTSSPEQKRQLQLELAEAKHALRAKRTQIQLDSPEQELDRAHTELGKAVQQCAREITGLMNDTYTRFKAKHETFQSNVNSTKQGRIWREFTSAHKNWWSNRHDWTKSGWEGVGQDFSNFFNSWGKFNKSVLNIFFYQSMPEDNSEKQASLSDKKSVKQHVDWLRGVVGYDEHGDPISRKRVGDYQTQIQTDLQQLTRSVL